MSQRGRLSVVGGVAVMLETALGTLVLATDGPPRIAAYLLACAVVTTAVLAGLWKLLGLPPRDSGGGRGGPPRGGDPPPPPWWPEFERAFRRHARERRHRTPIG